MPITFEFTDKHQYSDLELLRDGMGNVHNPLYTWANAADFDDDQVDVMLGVGRERSYRDKYVIPPVSSKALLSFFIEAGIHPAYVLPINDLEYPEPIVDALVTIAQGREFSFEARNEATQALEGIKSAFVRFVQNETYPERIEELWDSTQVKGLDLDSTGGIEGISKLFGGALVSAGPDPVLLTEKKFDLFDEFLAAELASVKNKLEKAEADKKRSNRRISDAAMLMFGDRNDQYKDDFDKRFDDAQAFIYACMKQPQISSLSLDLQWKCVADIVTDPQGDFRQFIVPGIEDAWGRVGEGRFFGWPNIGREYALAYKHLNVASVALKEAEQEVTHVQTELDHFRQFREYITKESREITLYHAMHRVKALKMSDIKDDLCDQLISAQGAEMPEAHGD